MKKILFVASECVPFIKTGGLADVCGALPKEFDKNYWDVRVVIPDYSCIPEQYRNNFEYVTHFYMSSGPYVQDKYVRCSNMSRTALHITLLTIRSSLQDFLHILLTLSLRLRSIHSLTRLYFQCSRLLISSRILYTVMTGRQVFCLYT